MKSPIPYAQPSITELEVRYVTDAVLMKGTQCYAYIGRFEEAFKKYLGTQYAVATSSCTGALHMGLLALGIKPDDEVIMGDTGWIATASAITYVRATPVFVDVLPDSWCLDPRAVERAITSKTKAIMAVHVYGNLCDLEALFAIGKKHGIPVIEDSAEALGSIYRGKRAGSMGAFGTFSFHGSKTISTGEGGMLVTNDADLYRTVLTLNNHGRSPDQKKQFWPTMIGLKYKMSAVQAAIGCAQMERVEEIVARKREILAIYKQKLSRFPEISLNPEPEGMVNGAWMSTVVFSKESGVTREHLQEAFREENIDARVFFWPLSSLPMFEPKPENVVAWDIPNRAINLPCYYDMTTEEMGRVVSVLERCLRSARGGN
ncbi:MAG: DegT/DnrJ/EryC1/StrS aminotransferase family protein [Holosporales bacterium]|nr:DegT/DnrJ/EryC1/StrS aminotransferase family protein [Holosporales bacterium]